ncbi:MAG: D-alanine--D-alanine ligase [Candidatus Pacebacteria bacterium]|jgi:D-alanine-D-alanine ligase|nr:D-alanine--D-alanine ligase [Candidatus Paceibacterota bacterium]MBT4004584.1 D-alanine--D-alanine ligase [Candidatus Paceibacterota bacterium]MBT4359168.1 D-alanine--D-alanine ligase [Candidatus Paceibacterota bacterium]MBT6898418.1 D-alanine--D-alanine ligase [Candidatus Paceibacterota bacterium]
MKNILIIFGGKSGEHEISVRSAKSIEENIDKTKFKTLAMGITHQGQWHSGPNIESVTHDGKVSSPKNPSLIPDKQILDADIIFSILHGPNGEDGTMQGLLELLNVAYVGPRVLGSALSMDKVIQKQVCAFYDIPQTKYISFSSYEWENSSDLVIQNINQQLQYPLFIKPANMGSSVGITKADSKEELKESIQEALQYDHKIIVEESIGEMREIEISVLGNNNPKASVCGEIVPNTEFYDYETKYITDDIKVAIPADIPQEVADEIRATAVETFRALDCIGLARVDFFYQPQTGKHFLNEINTLPGFTSISMYPKLWEATDLSYTDLITKLLRLAEEQWQKKQQLSYEYQPS